MSSRQAMCQGKQAYPSRSVAERSAVWRRRKSDVPVIAYHCRVCDGWHIGRNAAKP